MKKLWISIIGLVLLIPVLCWGWGIIGIGGGVPSGNGCTTSISDDFSGDLSKWTQKEGTWAISGGVLPVPDGRALIIYTDEATSSVNQWYMAKYVMPSFQLYHGIYFRCSNTGEGYSYVLRWLTASDAIAWRYCTDSTTTCTDIATDTGNMSITSGDYIGIEIEGTGTNTILRVWDLGPSPPANIDNCTHGDWGTATVTFTNDPAQVADTGTYGGLYFGTTGATSLTWDNWSGGHFTP